MENSFFFFCVASQLILVKNTLNKTCRQLNVVYNSRIRYYFEGIITNKIACKLFGNCSFVVISMEVDNITNELKKFMPSGLDFLPFFFCKTFKKNHIIKMRVLWLKGIVLFYKNISTKLIKETF